MHTSFGPEQKYSVGLDDVQLIGLYRLVENLPLRHAVCGPKRQRALYLERIHTRRRETILDENNWKQNKRERITYSVIVAGLENENQSLGTHEREHKTTDRNGC